MSDGFREFGRLQRRDGVAGGQVCLSGSGVIVTFLAEMFAAGDSIESIARNYGRSNEDIEAAIRIVVVGASGRFGIRRDVERRMEAQIPLLP